MPTSPCSPSQKTQDAANVSLPIPDSIVKEQNRTDPGPASRMPAGSLRLAPLSGGREIVAEPHHRSKRSVRSVERGFRAAAARGQPPFSPICHIAASSPRPPGQQPRREPRNSLRQRRRRRETGQRPDRRHRRRRSPPRPRPGAAHTAAPPCRPSASSSSATSRDTVSPRWLPMFSTRAGGAALRRRPVEAAQHPRHDVVDIGEIALQPAAVVDA